MAGTVEIVPLSEIKESLVALRDVDKSSENYQELVASIKNRGIINPPSVRRDEDDNLVLVDGLHRTTAAIDAGLTEIPVHILDVSEAEVLEIQIEANLQKVETKPMQYTRQLQRIMARHPERTVEEQAKRLNKSPGWVKERLNLMRLIDEAQEKVESGDISISNAYNLARLPVEEQEDWIDRAISQTPDEFVPSVLARCKEIKKEKKGETPELSGPPQRLRKLGDIKSECARAQQNFEESDADTYEGKYLEGMRDAFLWILQIDPASEASWKEEQEKLAVEKEARKKAAAEKRAREKAEAESVEA